MAELSLWEIIRSGAMLAILGATISVILGTIASSKATGRVGEAAVGLLCEDPSKFGGALVLQILPSTQGLYAFVVWFVAIFMKIGTDYGWDKVFLPVEQGGMSMITGGAILLACLPVAIVSVFSGLYQGRLAAASISILAKKPEAQGNAIVMCVMVEFLMILAFLSSLLVLFSL
ncbi:MAG: V-type ATP synthase subunit K [Oscillospiraceae bacterium]|nr:V-type ATP synthase subunit K [Oscillospiraceae bacterium]